MDNTWQNKVDSLRCDECGADIAYAKRRSTHKTDDGDILYFCSKRCKVEWKKSNLQDDRLPGERLEEGFRMLGNDDEI